MKGIITCWLVTVICFIFIESKAQSTATDTTKVVIDTTNKSIATKVVADTADKAGAKIVIDTFNKTTIKPEPVVVLPKAKPAKKPKPIRTEISGGFRLNTDGWALFVDKGWVKSEERKRDYFYDVKLAQIEFEEKKHPKELKRSNSTQMGDEKVRPYIYGKINNFYALKLGYGARKMIAGKPEAKTISIHWVYLGGLSAGFLKPYYLSVNGDVIKYTDTTRDIFLTPSAIAGGAGFMKGLNEVKVIPGVHIKSGLHFDFAVSKFTKLAIETGVNAELYMKKIELMATQKAVPYSVNIYASFQFGKRWQ